MKTIHINDKVSTYCHMTEGHEGNCEPNLEEWQIELAVKILQDRGYTIRKEV